MQVSVPRYEPDQSYIESLRNLSYYWLADQILDADHNFIDTDSPSNAEKQKRKRERVEYFYFSNYVRCPRVAFGTGTKWIKPQHQNESSSSTHFYVLESI